MGEGERHQSSSWGEGEHQCSMNLVHARPAVAEGRRRASGGPERAWGRLGEHQSYMNLVHAWPALQKG